jgi:dinuclear metal center YbgI/SA1388 family protein
MAELKKIVKFLDDYLKIKDFRDNSYNGLQVEGHPDVKKIVTAVDAGIDTFKRAIEDNADMIIVHHGHFWSNSNPNITSWKKERIDLLLRNGVSLYVAHLPLDAHKDVGNNAQLIKLLGGKVTEPIFEYKGQNIGWKGELKTGMSIKDIEIKLSAELGAKPKVLNFGRENIKTIAVCSGGGGYETLSEAMDLGVDLYLTGDSIEVFHLVKDAKMNAMFAGHHATEIVGVKALVEVVKKRFKIGGYFLDIPTGL